MPLLPSISVYPQLLYSLHLRLEIVSNSDGVAQGFMVVVKRCNDNWSGRKTGEVKEIKFTSCLLLSGPDWVSSFPEMEVLRRCSLGGNKSPQLTDQSGTDSGVRSFQEPS